MSNKLRMFIKSVKILNKEIKNEYKAEIIAVFGSYVRGDQKKNSDVDILVKFFKGATLLNFVGLANFLEEKLKLKIDIIPIDTIRKEIKQQVLKEAIYL